MQTILVVDDDYSILDAVRNILRQEGYAVQISSEGKTVQELTEQYKPDLILLDIRMAKPNGEAVVRKLRSYVSTRSIPIIFVSAQENIAKIAKDMNVQDYIKKPFEIDVLLKKIKKNLKNSY